MLVALQELSQAKEALLEQKKQILIDALIDAGGNRELIKELRSQGLPKTIFCAEETDKLLISHFSFFAPVVRSGLLNHPSVVFSWTEMGGPKSYMPDFFKYAKTVAE